MFRILDRYILRQIIFPFLLAVVVLTFVLEIPIILRQGEELVAKGVEWGIIGRVLVTLLPSQLAMTIPMSLLLGILIGFGRLSADREFVALQACGVSLMRLGRPLFLITVFATGWTAYMTCVVMPAANQSFREIAYEVMATKVERDVKPGVFFEDFPGFVIFARDVSDTGGWRDVFLVNKAQTDETTLYVAREGQIRLDRDKKVVYLELLDGTAHTTYASLPDKYTDQAFKSTAVTVDPKYIFKNPPEPGPAELTFAELRLAIAEEAARGDPGYILRYVYHLRLALPMTCPILAVIGLALGASTGKEGKLASFVVGFVVIFCFYLLLYSFKALAQSGRIPAEWGPWVPNLVMAIPAGLLIWWRARAADRPIRFRAPAFWTDWRRKTATEHTSPRRSRGAGALSINVPMLRLLDVYVAREYLRVMGVSLLALLGICYIATIIDLAEKALKGHQPLYVVLRFLYVQTPQFLFWVLPMAVLVATLVTMAVMTKSSELIVMRACGVSLYRTTAPLVFFALVASGVLFGLAERVLPEANREGDRLNRLIRGDQPLLSPFNQRWILARDGSILNYDSFDTKTRQFLRLRMYTVRPDAWRLSGMTFASTVGFDRPSADDPGASVWTGHDGWIRRFPAETVEGVDAVQYDPFTDRPMTFESPDYFSSRPRDTLQMSYDQMVSFPELRQHIRQLQASGAPVGSLVVALHRKIAFPLVTVLMTLLAVPFGVLGGQRGALYGIGVGIMIALGYFVTMSVFGAFGTGGVLPPALAAWAANLLFGAMAVCMILTVRT